MEKKIDSSKKRQIRNLLFVIGSGVLMAILFSTLLLYQYGPTGQYALQNVLISPDMTDGLTFNDKNPKTGGMSRFVFGDIQFEYDDLQKGQKEKLLVTKDQYRQFYNFIKGLQSLRDVSDEIKNEFNKGHPAKLKIMIRTESSSSWQSVEKIFQDVDFSSKGSYFRVQIRESDPTKNSGYAYFYHEGIYEKVIELFSTSQYGL